MLLPHYTYTGLCIRRGLLTACGNGIKNKEEILTLLDAVWEPERVAVIHCRNIKKRIPPNPGLGEIDWQIRPLNKQLRP